MHFEFKPSIFRQQFLVETWLIKEQTGGFVKPFLLVSSGVEVWIQMETCKETCQNWVISTAFFLLFWEDRNCIQTKLNNWVWKKKRKTELINFDYIKIWE